MTAPGRKQTRVRKPFKKTGGFYVYIVRCASGAYYTGSTKDLEQRIKLHNSGRGARYLKGKGPVELVYAKRFAYFKPAILAERAIKRLTRRRKEKLVRTFQEGEQL
ncbi:MAG TPA: GIY-YIG nuclease family protein [Candidatus Omnitrophota bacterium]|nr:GIY-YIG nuclease family protein [Candidatus Omnitrophota bacterium]